MAIATLVMVHARDKTAEFDALLGQRGASSTTKRARFDADTLESFLKEAYRINAHIARLHGELRDVRQAYLSTAQPRKSSALIAVNQPHVLTDSEREQVDANAKQMIRELNAGIRALDEAEQLRRDTERAVMRKKFASGLSALASWASGGGGGGGGGGMGSNKSVEHAAAEARALQVDTHRDGVLWFLRHRLELCCRTQQEMMETRLRREMDKSRGFLPPPPAEFAVFTPQKTGGTAAPRGPSHSSAKDSAATAAAAAVAPSQGLTEEQVQMFEEGNQDMTKHYRSTLEQVTTAEKSLVEISELQTLLVNNLATQSAHIEQLVTDSLSTTENVGGGNKQLKQATKRPSAARYTFFAASGLCAFLVVWDLLL